LEEKFITSKKKLTEQQLTAVEKIDGPVLVIAGPGTGKTQILAMRIAEILQKTDCQAENILAITFTDSGSAAMKNRLREIIGPQAHQVEISTFHSFCQKIITDFSEIFGIASFSVIDDLMRLQILQQILQSENFPNLTTFSDKIFFIHDISRAISALKKEGIFPEKFKIIAKQEQKKLAEIPTEEKINKKTGKMKIKFQKQEKKIAKWLELAEIFSKFQSILQKKNYHDFDDLILKVIEKLEESEYLRASIREKYLYFLVDEFQDTSGAQMKILNLIIGKTEQPNIFAVGDEDQSIYRFAGANLENIFSFQKNFSPTVISIEKNFRSTQKILNFSNEIIINNSQRLSNLNKKIFAASDLENSTLPQVLQFETFIEEQFGILEKVRQFLKKKILPEQIAILVRTNLEGKMLRDFLQQNGVDASFAIRENILENSEIRQILEILRAVENPKNSVKLTKIIFFDFFSFLPTEILEVLEMFRNSEQKNFFDFGTKLNPEKLCDEKKILAEKINKFCQKIAQWKVESENLPLTTFFKFWLEDSGILEKILLENSDQNSSWNFQKIDFLQQLFTEIKNLQSQNQNLSLSNFLELIEIREKFNCQILSPSIFYPSKTIKILTAHQAKGLEFEKVLIANFISGNWGNRRNVGKLSLPESILEFSQLNFADATEKNEEERRLFFVAATRAKSELIITFSQKNDLGKETIVSSFLDEIPKNFFTLEKISQSPTKKIATSILKSKNFSEKIWQQNQNLLREKVNNFVFSPTSLENFRICPRKFLFENLLRVPSEKNISAILGSALHYALEQFFQWQKRTKELPPKDFVITEFKNFLQQEKITPQIREQIWQEGKKILQEYFYENKFFPPVAATEMNFSSKKIKLFGEIPITGKIDKVEFLENEKNLVKIIDFKTSKPKSKNDIMGNNQSQKNNFRAGSMFRQLLFYKILLEELPGLKFLPQKFCLNFLKPNSGGKFVQIEFENSEMDCQELKEDLKNAHQNLQKLNFTKVEKENMEKICKKCGNNFGNCPFLEICWQKSK